MSNVRNRHPGSAYSRATHSGIYSPLTGGKRQPAVVDGARSNIAKAATMAEVRDGEAITNFDVGAKAVDTGHFLDTAKAPQVNNNPTDPASANVWIDPDGLHVTDGAIFLTDYAGQSVLSAAGFDGSWVQFLATGFYNGSFNAGTLQTGLSASTTGITYEDSLSLDVPFWAINNSQAVPTYGLVESGGVRGFDVQWTPIAVGDGTVVFQIYQDVPVAEGIRYLVTTSHDLNALGAGTAGDPTLIMSVLGYWYDADHAYISNAGAAETDTSSSVDTPAGLINWVAGVAPATAHYLRVSIKWTASVSSGSINMDAQLWNVALMRMLPVSRVDVAEWSNIYGKGYHTITDDGSNKLMLNTGAGLLVDLQIDYNGDDILQLKDVYDAISWRVDYGGNQHFSGAKTIGWDYGGGTTDDFTLGASATNSLLLTGATYTVERGSASNDAFGSQVTGDSVLRYVVDADGTISWGSGSAARDVSLYKTGSSALRIDDNSGGWAHLYVDGSFHVLQEDVSLTGTTQNPLTMHSSVQRINCTSATTVRALNLAGSNPNMLVLLINMGSATVTLNNNDGSADASNHRILTHTGANYGLTAGTSIWCYFDSTSNRWRTIKPA